MSTTELKIPFDTEKLDALRFFMDKKEQTVEKELKDYLDKTYERVVPANVREYVESRMDLETTQEQAPETIETPAPRERQPRPSRRQREQVAVENPPAPEIQSEAGSSDEEESQGMTMNM